MARLKNKICIDCRELIDPKNLIIINGYARSYCKPCDRIRAKKYNEKIKKLKKGTFWE